ncbi:MAG: hypothetical protein K8R69_07375 [Deltaproteobacteria bacterium]|nr:hypothetical protein [Deltaproteobacteria bacterium]
MTPRWPFLFRLLPLLLIFSLHAPFPAKAASSKAPKAAEGSKKTGYNGDPARKRGLEIGYDLGRKAGKSDLEQSLKPDPKRHEDFEKPEKYFRHEYGSQASFVGGFRSGFMGGYQAAFGKKVPMTATGVSGEKPKSSSSTGAATAPPKRSSGTSSSDAL